MDRLDGFVAAGIIAALSALCVAAWRRRRAVCWYGEMVMTTIFHPTGRELSRSPPANCERTVTPFGATGSIGASTLDLSSASAIAFASKQSARTRTVASLPPWLARSALDSRRSATRTRIESSKPRFQEQESRLARAKAR